MMMMRRKCSSIMREGMTKLSKMRMTWLRLAEVVSWQYYVRRRGGEGGLSSVGVVHMHITIC
jgi:hypothetical protein